VTTSESGFGKKFVNIARWRLRHLPPWIQSFALAGCLPVCHSTAEATSVVIFAAILEIVTDEANVAGRPGNVLNSDKDRTLQLL
jgi:hypothetical protein